MHKWHRARDNAAPKAVSHDQVVARAQLFYEGKQSGKVVAFVRISHDHIFALRCFNSRRQRRTVATRVRSHNFCIHALGELNGAIRATIIGNNDFAGDIVLVQKELRFLNASR